MSRLFLLIFTFLLELSVLSAQQIYWIDQRDHNPDNYHTAANEVNAIDSNQFILKTYWSNSNWGYQTHASGSLITLYYNNKRVSGYFDLFSSSYRGYPNVFSSYPLYKYGEAEFGQGFTQFHGSKFQYLDLLTNQHRIFEFEGALISHKVNRVDSSFYALVAPTRLYRPSGAINYSGLYSDTLFLLRFNNPNLPADTVGIYRQPIQMGYNYSLYLGFMKLDFDQNKMRLYRDDTLLVYDLDQPDPIRIDSIRGNYNFYEGEYWQFANNFRNYTLSRNFDKFNPHKIILHLIKNTFENDSSISRDTLYRSVIDNQHEKQLYGGYSCFYVDENEQLLFALSEKAPAPSEGYHSMLYKFDSQGALSWKDAFFTDSTLSRINGIDKAEDGTLYLAGTVYGSKNHSYYNIPWHPFVIKLDKNHPASLEESVRSNFTIFPNPSQHLLNLTSTEKFNEIRIVDALGRTLSNSKFTMRKFLEVNVEHLESGSYFIQIRFDSGMIKTQQFIIGR